MATIIKNESTGSVTTPDSGKILLFGDADTNTLKIKNSSGTIFSISSGSAATSFSVLRPSEITSNVNDYSPTNWDNSITSMHIGTDNIRNMTGVESSGFSDGQIFRLVNSGSNKLILINEDSNSSATNRIIIGGTGSLPLAGNDAVTLMYDTNRARWRVV